MEEEVKVTQNNDVSVDEYDLVVVSELPKSELAVVVLVVRALLGSRVSNTFDEADGPPGGGKGVAFNGGDGVVYEQDEVTLGACLEEALSKGYGSANVAFRGM